MQKKKGRGKAKRTASKRSGSDEIAAADSATVPRGHASHGCEGWRAAGAAPVSYVETRWLGRLGTEERDSVAVVCWNVLAPSYCFGHFYKHLVSPAQTLSWAKRSKMIFDLLRRMDADVVCLQEVESWPELEAVMAGFGYSGVFQGRTGHKVDGLAILWRSNKLVQVGRPDALLFDDVMGKEGENRVCLRVCLHFPAVPGRRLTVATTHLDYKRPAAQARMGRLFGEFCSDGLRAARDALVACGDFNCSIEAPAVREFLAGAGGFESALPQFCPAGTPVHSAVIHGLSNIDHMFFNPKFLQLSSIVGPLLSTAKLPHDEYPSDHMLVGARFELVTQQ